MKQRGWWIVCMLLLIVMVGCASGDGTTNGDGNEVGKVSDVKGTVRVALAGWKLENGIDPLTGVETVGLNDFLKSTFNKMYPNIKLEVFQIPWENAKAKQTAMLMSKDVDIMYTGGAFASQWYQDNLLYDLDELIAGDESFDPSQYLQGIWHNSYSTRAPDGSRQFGIPAVLGRRMIIYDQQLFEQWGVEALSENPSPSEVLEKAKQMTGKNPVTGEDNHGLYFAGNSLNGSTFVALALAFGAEGAEGSLSDVKNIKWKLNTPEMVAVMEWLQEAAMLAPPGFVNGQGAENFGLEPNTIAIGLDQSGGSTMSEYRANDNKELMARFPSTLNFGPDGEGWVAVDPFVMSKDVKDVEAAWETMKFLSGYETQKYLYINYSYTPTLSNADFIDEHDPYVRRALEIADVAHSELLDEANPFFMSDIVPAVNGFISQAATGKLLDVQEFLDELQARAEKWTANLR